MTSFNFVRILWYYKVLSLLKHVAVAGKPITEVKYVMYYRDKIRDISNTKGSENFPVVV